MAEFEPRVRQDWTPEERTTARDAITHVLSGDPRVRFGAVFGSFARGEAFADIDVAVALDEPWSYVDLGRIGRLISEAIGRGVEVDVVPAEVDDPWFRYRIAREGIRLWSRGKWDWPFFFSRAVIDGGDWIEALARAGHPGGRQPL